MTKTVESKFDAISGALIERTRSESLALMAVASASAVSASDWRISAVMADWVVQVDGSAWEYARVAMEKASRIGRERRRRASIWARGCGVPVLRTRRREGLLRGGCRSAASAYGWARGRVQPATTSDMLKRCWVPSYPR